MAADIFRLDEVANLEHIFADSAEISDVTAVSHQLYLGTTLGFIHRAPIKNDRLVWEQRKKIAEGAVRCVFYNDVCGILACVANDTLFLLDGDTLEDLHKRKNIRLLDLNVRQAVAHYPRMQYAITTTKNQVLLCHFVDGKEQELARFGADGLIRAMSLNGSSLLFVTPTGCFCHEWTSKARPVPLFAAASADSPITCALDQQATFLLSTMRGMAVFVNSQGQATRPPLVNLSGVTVSIRCHDEYICVLTNKLLSVFDVADGSLRQELPVPLGVSGLSVRERTAFLFTPSSLHKVIESDWIQKSTALLESGDYDRALDVAEKEAATRDLGGAEYEHVMAVRVECGLALAHSGQFEVASSALIAGHALPSKVWDHFKDRVLEAGEDKIGLITFLIDFFTHCYQETVGEDERKVSGTNILMLRSHLENFLSADDFSCYTFDSEQLLGFLADKKMAMSMFELRCFLASSHANPSEKTKLLLEAFELFRHEVEVSSEEDQPILMQHLFYAVGKINSKDIIADQLPWLYSADSAQVVNILCSSQYIFDSKLLRKTIKSAALLTEVVDSYLTRPELSANKEDLISLQVSLLSEDEENPRCFDKLAHLVMDEDVAAKVLLSLPSPREPLRTLAMHRKNPSRCLSLLHSLQSERSRSLATLLLQRHSSQHTLVVEYLQTLLQHMTSSGHGVPEAVRHHLADVISLLPPDYDFHKLLSQLPAEIPLNEFLQLLSPFLYKLRLQSEMSAVGRACAEAAEHCSARCLKGTMNSRPPFMLDDGRCCAVCGSALAPPARLVSLPSGFVVHDSCHPHKNLCPVTNALFSP